MINEVRNTVLSILNKNNYGYISPSDFNLFAAQAQMEMFEEAFSAYNKLTVGQNMRQMYEGYGDILQTYEELLEIFNVTKPLSNYLGNVYYSPSLLTTGDSSYLISRVICYPTRYASGNNTTVVSGELVDAAASFDTLGIVAGDIVVNATTNQVAQVIQVISSDVIAINNDIFTSPGQNFVIYKASNAVEAEKITQDKLVLLNTSLLTASSVLFPTYSLQGDKITVMPPSYKFAGQVIMNYFRYPLAPKWTYINLVGGEPVFDQSQPDYQDFELPPDYEYKLVTKILEYAGMSIRETEVAQFGMVQQSHEEPTLSVQQ
jgi:hypothetical protein